MHKIAIPPDKSNYAVTDAASVVEVKLDGGASARRLDHLNANSLVNCQWTLDQEEYFYIRAFFNSGSVKGSLPFLCDLVIDDFELISHTCYFVTGSFKLGSHMGGTYIVQAQLEIEPIPIDADEMEFNESFIDAFEAFLSFGAIEAALNYLHTIVNINWPHT